jgi:phenylacetate-coenzyme A ligase PaaK-like adenylate-forming protein
MAENILALAYDVHRARKEGQAGINRRQQVRLHEMVVHARANSDFYARHYRDLPSDFPDLAALPVTTKKMLMDAFDEWVTDPAVTFSEARAFSDDPSMVGTSFYGHTLATTSGTTGTKGIFLLDARTMAVTQAIALRMLSTWLDAGDVLRIIAGRARMAMVMAKGGHFASAVAAAGLIRRRPGSILQLSVHQPVPDLVAALNAFKPVLLAPYASIAALLATEQEQGRLDIHPVLLAISAEGLAPDEYGRIAKAVGAKVGNSYASTEVPFLSFSCKHGWLHVNNDWVTFEPVDAEFRPVPPGQVSHTVLVSNLANRLQPIIRYDLGDSVVEREDPCPCGSPFPAIRVQGRAADLVRFENAGGQAVTLPPLAFYTLLDPIAGIDLYQVVQTSPSALRIRLRLSGDLHEIRPRVEKDLRDLLSRHGLRHVRLEFGDEPPEQTPGGKVRPVIPYREGATA